MKTVVLLLLLIAPFVSRGQDANSDDLYHSRKDRVEKGRIDADPEAWQTQPFRKCNQIKLDTPDNSQDAFRTFIMLLQDAGEVVEKADKEMLSFQTEFRAYKGSYMLSIQGYVRDNTIILKAKWKIDTGARNPFGTVQTAANDAWYGTDNGNMASRAFKIMEAIAKSYPDGNVMYRLKQ
jgi:hypothetical protein